MEERNCLNCKYALWDKTSSGRLHPSGDGRCAWKLPEIHIPKAYFYHAYREEQWIVPKPSGGTIERKKPEKDCPCWEKKE